MEELTLENFIYDYEHFVVIGKSKGEIIAYIDKYYVHIKGKCLNHLSSAAESN